MKRKSIVLNKEERDILISGALCQNDRQLSNAEIGQRLGISVTRVKTIIHQVCVKLEAHNRNKAIVLAIKRGDIKLTEIFSFAEITERLSSLGPDILRRIAYIMRQELEQEAFLVKDQNIRTDRSQNNILTDSERDVLILAGCGLTNKEIADRFYISISAVATFLYRACTKLGTRRRADAVKLAVKQREISICDIFSINELMQILAPLGAESLEKIAQLIDKKLEQESIPTGC